MTTSLRHIAVGLISGITVLLSACGGDTGSSPSAPVSKSLRMGGVTAPGIDPIKLIASDGYSGSAYITNAWGGHQGRVTRHRDGTVRVLYIRPANDTVNKMEWRVMKRNDASDVWTEEQTGLTTDDVNLLRDPGSDGAYVVAYPNSVPTVYLVPGYTSSAIPGTWENVSSSKRHYSAAGIGADGTLCFKASVELSGGAETSNTQTHFICGKYTPASGWSWNTQRVDYIGERHGYDYLFPGGYGTTTQLVATAQRDLFKTAAGYPNAANNYSFNGISMYTADTAGTSAINGQTLLAPYTTSDPLHDPLAPVARMQDSFIDSKHRLITSYGGEPGTGGSSPEKRFYTIVKDANGAVLQSSRWTGLPTYGYIRIFEDGKQRLWLLWTNQGTQLTQMKLYRLQENSTGDLFTLGTSTDFSSAFAPYSIDGWPRLALTSRGQPIDTTVEGVVSACEEVYVANQPFTTPYYPGGAGTQKIIHFRIHLPD